MQISPGTRIGSYEVQDKIGAGGMGNVYRAHDQRLGRDVAIKTLPDHLAADPAAMARFEREARFVAALNHPNIAAIYGIEEHTGERILVLELVRGETLDAVLQRGPLPVDRAIRVAGEIASALEGAHNEGIIHRDLKPSNVKITPDGHVKLLDFGIAKHRVRAHDELATQPALTREGSVLGTPQYMSPEQILGQDIDRRADIWAFGCLLFEMLSGRRPFDGPTFVHLADAVRNDEPDWSALPAATPAAVRQLVQRCLRKNADERLHDIADARVELHDAVAARTAGRQSPARRRLVVAGTVAAVGLLTLVAWRISANSEDAALVAPRLTQLTSAGGIEEFPAWAPDGAAIAYAAPAGAVRKIFVRNIATGVERQVTAGELDDLQPVWTPDGARILFVRGREANRRVAAGETFSLYDGAADVWAVEVATGRERRLIADAFYPSISPDGRRIAVDASWAGPRRIWMTDDRGFNPQQLTSEESEAVYHIAPRWAPDGRRIVYQRIERTKFDLASVDVATRRTTIITDDTYRELNPAWGADGRWIYFSSDRGGGINLWRLRVRGDATPIGSPQQLTNGAGQDVQLALAPDGMRLAYATLHQNADLWRLPIDAAGRAAGVPVQVVASSREDSRGAWSADARSIAFNSDRNGDMNIWVHSLSDGTTRQVTRGSGGDFQPQWSPDGRTLVFFSSRDGSADIWTADAESGAPTQLTRGPALDINPFFSPDGREIVFQSDSSGRMELWIVGADGSNRRQLTTIGAGGHFQRWLPDGWIYFRSTAQSALMRIRATGGEPELVSRSGGAHISFLPSASRLIDVIGHLVVRSWNPSDGSVENFFRFPEADVRIDYPSVSPDGRWLLFDRFRPEGGDIWLAEGIARRR